MEDWRPGQMVGNWPAAVPLLWLARGRFLSRRGIGRFIWGRRCDIGIEEVELPGVFRHPLASRPEEQAFQREEFFLEAGVGPFHLFGGRDQLVELPLEVDESHQGGAEQLLAGGKVVGDGVEVDGLRHNYIYV
jgi:hypothetical protein